MYPWPDPPAPLHLTRRPWLAESEHVWEDVQLSQELLRGPVEEGPHRSPVLRHAARDFFNDNLLVRVHLIIVMIRRAGPAP